MRPFLYLIGASGSGKSTALSQALSDAHGTIITPEPKEPIVAHTRYDSGAIQLGYERRGFSGTDTLPLNAQPRAAQMVYRTTAPAIIAEGDRLANAGFFRIIQQAGFDLTVAFIDVDDETAAARRGERDHAMTDSFTKGRDTKARTLALTWTPFDWWIDGNAPIADIASKLQEHPAIQIALAQSDDIQPTG